MIFIGKYGQGHSTAATVPGLAHHGDPGSAPGHLLDVHGLQLGDQPLRTLARTVIKKNKHDLHF